MLLQLREDDETWYASARWVLGREDTISFVADALISHLAPLYVPYAPNTAVDPIEVPTRRTLECLTGASSPAHVLCLQDAMQL
jgi:hypothetical protein